MALCAQYGDPQSAYFNCFCEEETHYFALPLRDHRIEVGKIVDVAGGPTIQVYFDNIDFALEPTGDREADVYITLYGPVEKDFQLYARPRTILPFAEAHHTL